MYLKFHSIQRQKLKLFLFLYYKYNLYDIAKYRYDLFPALDTWEPCYINNDGISAVNLQIRYFYLRIYAALAT